MTSGRETFTVGPVTIGDGPVIMGIVNVTPDSFSDGGAFASEGTLIDIRRVVAHAEMLVRDGALIIDIGGESTRPGATPVTADEELRRVLPVLEALAHLPVALSIDTSKAVVAEAALQAGARIVNDITGLRDPAMARTVAKADAALIIMHMRGTPKTMHLDDIRYDDVTSTVVHELAGALTEARGAGIKRVMVDPGLGFGKTAAHNLTLTRELAALRRLGVPVVYGPSRKRFLSAVTDRPVTDRDRATAAACAIAVLNGADVVRVHDVAACIDAVKVAAAVRSSVG